MLNIWFRNQTNIQNLKIQYVKEKRIEGKIENS